jgi:hypothetical protein
MEIPEALDRPIFPVKENCSRSSFSNFSFQGLLSLNAEVKILFNLNSKSSKVALIPAPYYTLVKPNRVVK